MDTRKPTRSDTVVDESDITKSAAWAWYEHGSGSTTNPTREFDVWRTKMEPKPSRYKLEALRNVQHHQNSNSLLDSYEIERISKQLHHYIESSHDKCRGGGSGGVAAPAAASNKAVGKKKIPKGFWLRHVPACGSSKNDVVENRLRRGQRPEKGTVEVVGFESCRPRPWGIRA